MNEETNDLAPKAVIQFTRSSTKDAGEGYSIRVTDQATQADVDRAYALAADAREKALAALRGATTEELLELSIKAMDVGHDKFMAEAGHDLR